jgi:hypothetical protein
MGPDKCECTNDLRLYVMTLRVRRDQQTNQYVLLACIHDFVLRGPSFTLTGGDNKYFGLMRTESTSTA